MDRLTGNLAWNVFWRVAAWGFALGAILGGLVLIGFGPGGALLGLILGGGIGLIVGLVDAFFLGASINHALRYSVDLSQEKARIARNSAIVCGLVVLAFL